MDEPAKPEMCEVVFLPHRCQLPDPFCPPASLYPVGTVVRCAVCGSRWEMRDGYPPWERLDIRDEDGKEYGDPGETGGA